MIVYEEGANVLSVVHGIVALYKGLHYAIFKITSIGRWLLSRQGVACGGQQLFVPVEHPSFSTNSSFFPMGNYPTPIITHTLVFFF